MKRGNALDKNCVGYLPSAAWAWESLRRNPDYRREYFSLSNKCHQRLKLDSGGDLIRIRRNSLAEKWGLCFYENPDLCANLANVFWHPDVFGSTLKVDIKYDEETFGDALKLSALPVRKTVLDIPERPRQIRIYAKGCWLQLRAYERMYIHDQSNIEIQLRRLDTVDNRMVTMMQLFGLYKGERGDQVPTNSRKLKQYLRAFDVKSAGGSYRDVSIALEGIDRVREDWSASDCYLKDRARRAFRRGKALVDGDYIRLLN